MNADKKVIVNCLPLTSAEKELFLEASGNIRQEFVGIESQRSDMRWHPRIPAELCDIATAVIGNAPIEDIKKCHNLEWFQTDSSGIAGYLADGVLPKGARISNAAGAYGQAVSENALGLMLAQMKNIPLYRDLQNKHLWGDEGPASSPVGATVLIVGTGDIGSHFGMLVKALGANTIGVRRNPLRLADGIDEMHGFDELNSLIPRADVIALFLPTASNTNRIIGKRQFELMKPTAILINGGRGTTVDTDALIEALESGQIRAAGIDVTDPEPLPSDNPLWQERKCMITPHIAGANHLPSTAKRIIEISINNLRSYAEGIIPGQLIS